MIDKKTRGNRLRRHRKLKTLYEARLALAVTDYDKKYLEARIVEIDHNIEATKGNSVEGGVTLSEPIVLLPAITKTAEENAKKAKEQIVQPIREKQPKPERKPDKVKKVGNPF